MEVGRSELVGNLKRSLAGEMGLTCGNYQKFSVTRGLNGPSHMPLGL